jgi:DNA-binding beta-propeller fold protein YncE
MKARITFGVMCSLLMASSRAFAGFINFETAPVHPIELGPDGRTLAVCNLPDNRIELFDVSSGTPQRTGSLLVGHDPVSVRFRTTNELWVVNHISSSVNVIDLTTRQITAILQTKAGPADLVFAGDNKQAYVSCSKEDTIQVFHPETHILIRESAIAGDRPKALAVSPDGASVYAAIFESGNASTILAPRLTPLDQPPLPSVVDDPEGPYQGQDPPPNAGVSFSPPMSQYLHTNLVHRGSLIVKKNAAGRWMDDNAGDWSEFVSGAKATRSGRVPGWDMPDRDLAVIDTSTHAVTYARGLMNICMAVAVNPASGQVTVVGTDAKNEVRFEPNLRGKFLRVQLASVNPVTLAKTIHDLNPHLDYTSGSIPLEQRTKSMGEPRGIVWNGAGTRGYITGMGSQNLIVIDSNGERLRSDPIDVGEGPTGMALDDPRGRLYVLNRFSSSLTVLDTSSFAVLSTVAFFDPTPEFIKVGRRLFYDTRRTSGLGHVSCASCHVDVRFDRLAWDLGIPNGDMIYAGFGFGRIIGSPTAFHPMKGPMVTLTLQDSVGLGQQHWRGDRDSLLDFHITFTDLLGADNLPTVTEMRQLQRFLAAVRFGPNHYRNLDNTLPENVPLPGQYGVGGTSGERSALPNGNAQRGFNSLFIGRSFPAVPPFLQPLNCAFCHDCESLTSLEHPLIRIPRSDDLTFRSPSLRSVAEKTGTDFSATESRAGFGFMHDGRADTLTRFLVDGFGFDNDQDIADMIAFLLSAPGGDLSCSGDSQHTTLDAPASLGRQASLTSPVATPELETLLQMSQTANGVTHFRENALGLIASGRQNRTNRTWYLNEEAGYFDSDRNGESLSFQELFALASQDSPLTFMIVTEGAARRLAVDRDDDGVFDRTELDQGSDPLDVGSPSNLPWLDLTPVGPPGFTFFPGATVDVPLDVFAIDFVRHPNRRITYSFAYPEEAPPGASIDPTGTRLLWQVLPEYVERSWTTQLRVHDNAQPDLQLVPLQIRVLTPLTLTMDRTGISSNVPPEFLILDWRFSSGVFTRYEIQTANSAAGPWRLRGTVHRDFQWIDWNSISKVPEGRLYRIKVSY